MFNVIKRYYIKIKIHETFFIIELCKQNNKIHVNFLHCEITSLGIKFTTFDDWMEIDKIELERGKTEGKSRQKICDVKEMLQTANVQ